MRWIIGDIHGMLRPLEALVHAVSTRDPGAQLIFVGDYVNRGADSRRVIDLLLTLSNATFLRGNHDDVFDLILHGDCYMCHQDAPNAVAAFAWFMQHGLDKTLVSYGADWAELDHLARHPNPHRVAQLASIVPETHRAFIRDLRPVLEHPDLFVAHGYWDVDTADDGPDLETRLMQAPKLRYQLLLGRFSERQVLQKKRWGRTGYFGHTPVVNYRASGGDYVPVRGPKMVLLDTAVAISSAGALSAVCAETGTLLQADRGGDISEGDLAT